jgi:hypothetical protein
MTLSRGLVSLSEDGGWEWRGDAFDGLGCGPQSRCPLVAEEFRFGQMDAFGAFLRSSSDDAMVHARSRVSTSSLLASVGMGLASQVAALRYRTIVNTVVARGWTAMQKMQDSGVDAEAILYDPVFAFAHSTVLEEAAASVAKTGPWGRSSALETFSDFMGNNPEVRRICVGVLTNTTNFHICARAYDFFGSADMFAPKGRTTLMAGFWKDRRDEFDAMCEEIGVARHSALQEAYARGCSDAIPALVNTGNSASMWRCAEIAISKKDRDSIRLLAVAADPEGAWPPYLAEVAECYQRIDGLEKIVADMLVEKMQ